MDRKALRYKYAFCPAVQNPLALRSTRALSCILDILSDELSPERDSSGS